VNQKTLQQQEGHSLLKENIQAEKKSISLEIALANMQGTLDNEAIVQFTFTPRQTKLAF